MSKLFSPEYLIALASLIISITAIILSIVEFRMQRIHNYKSIEPIGHIETIDLADEISIKINNSGIGPLIVKEVFFNYCGNNLYDAMPNEIRKIPHFTFWSVPVVKAEHSQILFRCHIPETHKDYEQRVKIMTPIRCFLMKSVLEWSYTDIYGHKKKSEIIEFSKHFPGPGSISFYPHLT